ARERTWPRPGAPLGPDTVAPATAGSTSSKLLASPPGRRAGGPTGGTAMDDFDIIYGCCAGLDGHKKTVVACARRLDPDGRVHRQTRTFGTTTAALLELADWLAAAGVTHVAMESTGVYWKPVYHILEGHFALVLANAGHIKNVEGRKTDVKDAERVAQLLQHGLLRPSFVAPEPVRDLRGLSRQRAALSR